MAELATFPNISTVVRADYEAKAGRPGRRRA